MLLHLSSNSFTSNDPQNFLGQKDNNNNENNHKQTIKQTTITTTTATSSLSASSFNNNNNNYNDDSDHQRWHKNVAINLLWCWPNFLTIILISWLYLCVICFPLSEAVGYSYTRFVGPVRGPELEIVTDDPVTGNQHLDYIAKPEYEFSYGVEDAEARILHNRNEVRDGDEVKGVYSLVDPDGTLRVVKYTADGVNGFQAEVITNGLSTLHGHQPGASNGQSSSSASGSNSAGSNSATGQTQYQPGSFRPSLPTFVSPAYVYQKQQQELLQKQQQQQQQQNQNNHLPGIITTKLTPPGTELQAPNQYNPYDPRSATAINHNANNNNNNNNINNVNNNNVNKNEAKDAQPNYKVRENPKDNGDTDEGNDEDGDEDDYESNDDDESREGRKKKYQDTEENDDDDDDDEDNDNDDDDEDYEEEVEDYDDDKKKPKKHYANYADSNEEY